MVSRVGARFLLVTGSREWSGRELVRLGLSEAIRRLGVPVERIILVWGGARGLDTMAAQEARAMGLVVPAPHLPNWRACGRSAAFRRNITMVDHVVAHCCDVATEAYGLAFALNWDSGTGHCARHARAAGIRVVDYGVNTRIKVSAGDIRGGGG